jgi:hypothetical protein
VSVFGLELINSPQGKIEMKAWKRMSGDWGNLQDTLNPNSLGRQIGTERRTTQSLSPQIKDKIQGQHTLNKERCCI